jgi:hypothetical protein
MPRRPGAADLAIEAQVAIGALQRSTAPLYEAAMASGDFSVMAETKALAGTLRTARLQARRIAGLAEGIECPDGLILFGHGRAA